ncbi:hypothetical protein SAMN05444285_101147 [Draconibacterium orientale]|jgi:hypothetical protein|uniref:Energy transducer TonB n=1 Tax=Draconibacterium orientale TaxID=1168034 RepID=X5DNL3_9BACT|nr:hypothetical protein [Draconibacterium orientale]AHW62217.1 hypothetical protein FH5T_17640 [Draconibacterium orientale]SES67229.1 hypothetical protein SAMN05444285_101147 [Draconibacterium orientale]
MKIGELYRRNVYGVIGTLVFHILLFSAFLLADVNRKGIVKEEEILIEFPAEMLESEIIEPETAEEESTDQPDNEQTTNTRTNVASNRSATENTTTSTDEFFDDDYLKEVEAAKQLVSNVNKNLAKETVDLSDIEMPVETTEGMDRDSIKNVIYAGESNIVYYLENRYHLRLPVPVYLSQGGGTIIVDIVVNRQGEVIEAEPRDDRSIRDKQLFAYAKEAATRTVFNSDNSAPARQKGTIQYTFVAQ